MTGGGPSRSPWVDHDRRLVVGAEGQERKCELLAEPDANKVRRKYGSAFLKHAVNLVPIGRGPSVENDHPVRPPSP